MLMVDCEIRYTERYTGKFTCVALHLQFVKFQKFPKFYNFEE